jgi:uncharacterized protein
MGNPVVHFEVVGKDASRLQRFYANAFGWEMKPEPAAPGYSMAHPNVAGGINGGVGAAPNGGPGHVTFYVEVPDLAVALGTIEKLGGRRVVEPRAVPGGRIAMFSDPEGHVVGLFQTGAPNGM